MTICRGILKLLLDNLNFILELRNSRILKEDNSYVTNGDYYVQSMIANYLKKQVPEYIIISEESYLNNEFIYDDKLNYAVVDPIDGTENFTSGLKEWGVSVSLYRQGLHFESLLACPELNESLITGAASAKYKSRIYGLSSSLRLTDLKHIPWEYEFRIMGCSVYNLLNVIRGSYDVFENFKGAHSWDILAGVNLAIEHGLKVTVNRRIYNGEFLDPSQRYHLKITH